MSTIVKTVKEAIKYWYIPLIVGLLFLLTGIYTLASPLESYVTLSMLFSLTFIMSGISEAIFAITNRKELDHWGWTLIYGILTFLVGLLLVSRIDLSMLTLSMYVGFIVLFRSIAAISFAIDLRSYGVKDWIYLLLTGVFGGLFAFALLWNPSFAGLTVVGLTGIALLVSGAFSIYFSFKLKSLKNYPEKIPQELKERLESVQKEIQSQLRVN